MIAFPIDDLMDEQACYDFLLDKLHPGGLHCPSGHALPADQAPHDRSREPIVNYRCRECGRVFNIFTNTALQGIGYDCVTIVLMLRGFVQGRTTRLIARELDRDYSTVLKWRHRLQGRLLNNTQHEPLPDQAVEADEVYQNAGQKGDRDDDDDDPPRSRANAQRGRGTLDSDRPPIVGVVGREQGGLQLQVQPDVQQETIVPMLKRLTQAHATVYTDELSAYNPLQQTERTHKTVQHSAHEWARDENGKDDHEVHSNTIEGIWTAWRNFIRPFRGVHQRYLPQYVTVFEWLFNLESVTAKLLRALVMPDFTLSPI